MNSPFSAINDTGELPFWQQRSLSSFARGRSLVAGAGGGWILWRKAVRPQFEARRVRKKQRKRRGTGTSSPRTEAVVRLSKDEQLQQRQLTSVWALKVMSQRIRGNVELTIARGGAGHSPVDGNDHGNLSGTDKASFC
ncbi:hypothetical protein KCP78_08970 [Salmonella enterica subsp. enterica]|nr:hypothetical protein KCP78_08970 [Salmonella enterica subsp. enterica]